MTTTEFCRRLVVLLCVFGWASGVQAAIPAAERTVLTNLYASTNGASWTNKTNWNGAVGTECTWFGVTCDATQSRVTTINLVANNLVGSLPSIASLTALQFFYVNTNQLTGSLPSLSGLTALRGFGIQFNQLTGPIPPINGLTALQSFNIGDNRLTGPIPSLSGMTSLQYFNAEFNQLTGSIPSLGGLIGLTSFTVAVNRLSGTIPSLGGLTNLDFFAVFGNQLTGSVPSPSGLTSLRYFGVQQNLLTGPIPSLNGLPALRTLYVYNNQLSGSIPPLSGLTALQDIQVQSNQLSGPVPAPPTSLLAGQSNLCGNTLLSSGNSTIDTAWVTAHKTSVAPGGNWLACQTPTVPPTCTLTASPASITVGGTSTLTANCAPGATAFSWTGGTCDTTGSTCTVTPSVTTTYTVRGSNIIGVGNTSSATVTVTPVSTPLCNPTASPTTISAGGSSTITANCSPAVTSHVWTGGTCAGTTAATCVVSPAITTLYSVAGVNSGGKGPASNVEVLVNAAAPLFCTLNASRTSINPGGTSTLTTSCNATPSSYVWTGGTCAGTTASTCVVSPSATTSYTVSASTFAGSYTASATVTVLAATAVPVCDLIVSPAAIPAGRTSTLTASCSPSATAYSWAGGTCAGTIGPTCVVTPTVTTTYTVRGSNAIGIGNFARGTVTIVAPVFPLSVTGSITPAVANITADIKFRPQEVGKTGNVYVFALAPANLVKNIPAAALADHKGPVTRSVNTADTPTACVLAQLINGELKFATVSTLQAFLTGVLSSLGASVNVLNGVSTAQVGGAIFYVGYGTDPNTMILNGTNQNVVEVPGANVCQPQAPQTGWWWYPLQDGRGFGIEVQGTRMFMSGYLYDSSGHATWVVAEGGVSIDGSLFSGDLYQVGNGQTLTGAYKKPTVSTERPGPITLSFTNSRSGTLIWPGGIVPIQRFDDIIGSGNGVTPTFVPENGWWWNESESGRGYFIELKNNYAFIAGYMYEADGRPVWYIAEGKMNTPQSFSSTWYQAGNGQTLTGPYKKPNIVNGNVGSIAIQFQTATSAILTLPTGRQITITRQLYGL